MLKNKAPYYPRGLASCRNGRAAPHFFDHGSVLPDKIDMPLAFTSTGKRGHMAGECWHADLSGDQHFEIYIRPDKDDPLEVLGVLVHELN